MDYPVIDEKSGPYPLADPAMFDDCLASGDPDALWRCLNAALGALCAP